MSENLAPAEPVEVELPRVRDEHFSILYSNWIQAGRTPWDIALAFGRVQEIEPDKSGVIELVNVVLTPALAKALINTLIGTMKEYERDNGEVTIPASLRRLAQERTKRTSGSPSASPSTSPSPSPSEGAPEDET